MDETKTDDDEQDASNDSDNNNNNKNNTNANNSSHSRNPTTNPADLTDPLEIMQLMEHYNNLALVYHSNGKPDLALHAWSKALSIATSDKQASAVFQSNGTPQTNHQISILYNASLSCLQHQKYSAAYQCMSIVVKHWVHRADCWLRLAEACIGWYSELKGKESMGFQYVENTKGYVWNVIQKSATLFCSKC